MSRATLQADAFVVADQPDDWDLLRRYIDLGSEAAFSELVGRHLGWVHATCRKSLRDRQMAEDAAQAVFIIFARRAASIPPQARLSGWLFNTARFVVKDALKQRARYRRREEIAREMAIERFTPSRPAVDSETQTTLDDALATLTERDRQALLMHFYEGLSLGEMAEVLEISKEGVKKRVGRALSRLRARLGKKKAGATLVAVALLLRSNAASAVPMGLGRAVISGATIPGRASVVADWMATQAMRAVAGASGRLLRAALAAEIVGALTVVGVWSLPRSAKTVAPAPMAQTTQAPAPILAFVPGSLPPAPRKSNPPTPPVSSEPPYHSGADDPEPKAPALARGGGNNAPEVKTSKPVSREDDSRAAPMNLVYAGVPPVSRGGWLDGPTPLSSAPLRQGNGPTDSAGAVMISPGARSSDKSEAAPRRAMADRWEGVVAQCLSLLPSSVDKDGHPRLHHEMDDAAGHSEHLDGGGPGFGHHRPGDSNEMSPAEVALGGEPADPMGGHVQRDFDRDGHPRHHAGHDGQGDFIERPDYPEDFDSGLCGPPPWLHDGVHCHRPHSGGVDENSSYLSPGEFVQAPEPGFLGMAAVLMGAMGLGRRRRRVD